MSNLVLIAPLDGWSAPLDEVPDPVFSARLLGDGVAIDPTGATLHAPCDGEIVAVPPQKHAITLRAANGAQILLHVGIDTVALDGVGFESHVAAGARVKAGDRLLSFDLDLLAQRAKSVITPTIVTDDVPFSIVRRSTDRAIAVGDFLMELASAGSSVEANGGASREISARTLVPLAHGLHARPAALVAARLKHLAATVTISVRGKSANARSATSVMSLGVRKDDEITVSASGPDAGAAIAGVQDAIRSAAANELQAALEAGAASARSPRSPARQAAWSQATQVMRGQDSTAARDSRFTSGPADDGQPIRGVIAVPGLAVGAAFHLMRADIQVSEVGADAPTENRRLDTAIAAVSAELRATVANGHGPGSDVFAAHLEFLDDPELVALARERIASGKSAGFAWRQAVRANVDTLRALPDARMAERAADLLDLETQVLVALERDSAGANSTFSNVAVERGTSASPTVPDRAIILAVELLPSQFIALDANRIAGICTAGGGPTSHVAILAAAANIPMLVAAGPGINEIANGTPLILDADQGSLQVAPAKDQLAAAEATTLRRRERSVAERAAAQRECRTADDVRIEVFANVGSADEARVAVAQGAEGCGLLRTEFLFLDRDTAPEEAAQTALYAGVVAAFEGRPVVVRTLDAGGDKPLAYMPLPIEDNPALGVRGIRAGLLYPNVLRSQLRAILSAQPRGRCRILLPMVTDPSEVRAIGEMLDDVRRELGHDDAVPLGAMIETPAAAMLADQIAREADFLSIGTNDLTQYALAIDRGNPVLASRLDSLHPAVLRLIARTAQGAQAYHRELAVCGGLASDPIAVPILIGLGVTELSAVPAIVPRLKALIGTLTLADCTTLAQRALEQSTAAQVRALVTR